MLHLSLVQQKLHLLKKINEIYGSIIQESALCNEEDILALVRKNLESLQKDEVIHGKKYENLTEGDVHKLEIGVLGTFNAGKSSFLNSLLGEQVLKIDSTPSTAKISRLQYGKEFEIFRKLKNGNIDSITVEEFTVLSNHQNNSSAYDKEIDHFIIEYPADVLKRFVFIDTPGFFSLSSIDDELTKNWVPKLDLIIWLTGPETGGCLTEEQKNLLKELDGKQRICVFNKADTVVLSSSRERIKMELMNDFQVVLPYSSKCTLEWKQRSELPLNMFGNIFENVSSCFKNYIPFNCSFNGKKLEFSSEHFNDELIRNSSSDNSKLCNNVEHEQYHTILVDYLDTLRKRIFEFKRDKLNQDLEASLDSVKEDINLLINKLQKRKGFLYNYNSQELKDLQNYKKIALEKLDENYQNIREYLFKEVRKALFREEDIQKGDFIFKDTIKVLVLRTDVSETEILILIKELIDKFFNDYIKIAFDYLRVMDDKDSELIQTINPERELVTKWGSLLVSSVGNSVKVLLEMWKPDKGMNIDIQKEKLEEYIDWIIPDEEFNKMIKDSMEYLSNLILNKRKAQIQQTQNDMNLIELKLQGVVDEINY